MMQQREHWLLSQTSIFSYSAPKLHRTERSENYAPFMLPEVKEVRATAAT